MNFVAMTGCGAWIFVNEILLLPAAAMIMILHEQQRDLMVSCVSTPLSHVQATCCPSRPDCGRVAAMPPGYIPANTTLDLPVTNRMKQTRESNSSQSSSLTLFITIFRSNELFQIFGREQK
jgi:hypothetical protein